MTTLKISKHTANLHLYVSLACPFAHRVLIMRDLHNLNNISVDIVDPVLGEKGWLFSPSKPGCTKDSVYGFDSLRKVYQKTSPGYSGSITVPLLIDTLGNKMISNESADIVEMMDGEFTESVKETSDFVHQNISTGVYKVGFSKDQEGYDKSVKELFNALDTVEEKLKTNKYLTGDTLTAADVFLFTTMIRFDPVYVQCFKCNMGMVRYDYPGINRWLKHLYWELDFKESTDFKHIKQLYYAKAPYGIIPAGPTDIEEL